MKAPGPHLGLALVAGLLARVLIFLKVPYIPAPVNTIFHFGCVRLFSRVEHFNTKYTLIKKLNILQLKP